MNPILKSQFATESPELLLYAAKRALAAAQAEAAWLIQKAAAAASMGRWEARLASLMNAQPKTDKQHADLLKALIHAQKRLESSTATWEQAKPNQFKMPNRIFWIQDADPTDLLEMDERELLAYALYCLIPQPFSDSYIARLAKGLAADLNDEAIAALTTDARLYTFDADQPIGKASYLDGNKEAIGFFEENQLINDFEAKLQLHTIHEHGIAREAALGELAAWGMINSDLNKNPRAKREGWAKHKAASALEGYAKKIMQMDAIERGLDPHQYGLSLLNAPARHSTKANPYALFAETAPTAPAAPQHPGKQATHQELQEYREAMAQYHALINPHAFNIDKPQAPSQKPEKPANPTSDELDAYLMAYAAWKQDIADYQQAMAEWNASHSFYKEYLAWNNQKFLAISDPQDLLQASLLLEGADSHPRHICRRMRLLLSQAKREARNRRPHWTAMSKKELQEQQALLEMDPLEAALSQAATNDPEFQYQETLDRWMQIWKTDSQLSGKEIEALSLRAEGATNEGIALLMGYSRESSARSLLKRAKIKALRALANSGEQHIQDALTEALAASPKKRR